MERRIVAFGSNFIRFYKSQDLKIQSKIDYVFDIVRFESFIPSKFFKHIESTNGIYEIRVITTFRSMRFLCFFDEGHFVVVTNCYIKKTQEIPRREIIAAERLRKEYFIEKNRGTLT